MLKDKHYHQFAEEFGTAIGIAEWTEPIYDFHANVNKMPDSLKVAILTRVIINEGIYQKVMREVLRLKAKYKNKRINETTIYEKALNNLMEQNEIHSIV